MPEFLFHAHAVHYDFCTMKDLRVTNVQATLAWEQPEKNREHFSRMLESTGQTDIVLLPEMFTTGFTMDPETHAEPFHAETMVTLAWMRMWAARLFSVVAGTVSVEDGGHYYNRLLWVRPDGTFSSYDKRHLFSFGGEDKHYARGEKRLVETVEGWRICPLICYDLRFPVWSRNSIDGERAAYDVLLYSANWPTVRIEPWNKLLEARAIENQCYVAACNRVGTDAAGQEHRGDSAFIGPRGQRLQNFLPNEEAVRTQVFSWEELHEFRTRFPVLNDADIFVLGK